MLDLYQILLSCDEQLVIVLNAVKVSDDNIGFKHKYFVPLILLFSQVLLRVLEGSGWLT